MSRLKCITSLIIAHWLSACVLASGLSTTANVTYEIDPKGYVLFCLCNGRTGNQMEYMLGAMALAKAVDRTLVIPHLNSHTYKVVPFIEYYDDHALQEYHRVIPPDAFMEQIAPEVWPVGKRYGFCFKPYNHGSTSCDMKQFDALASFWNGLGVEFDDFFVFEIAFHSPEYWIQNLTPDKYPVIALRGAPASFPMKPKHWGLQKYVRLSPRITDEADKYIEDNFPDEVFVGIHLRNGIDWSRACGNAVGRNSYMASPQCKNGNGQKVSQNLCLPDEKHVVFMTKKYVEFTGATVVFVATDKLPMIKPLENAFKDLDRRVRVFHLDPWLPQVDQHILIRSDHFIGNCVSSFTSFVTRTRAYLGRPTSFFGLED